MHRSTVLLAAAAAVLLLGVGCKKEQPAPAAIPTPTAATPVAAPVTPEPGAGLIAPAPTAPPPPDIPSVPSAPPTAADVVAPAPPPSSPRELVPSSPTEGPPTPVPPPTPEPTVASLRVIRIIAKQWEWQPREIRVRKGERVALEITNADVPHGINIPEFNVNKTLAPGRTERVEFTATKVGRFDFVCSVFCGQGHRDMRGVLIVED